MFNTKLGYSKELGLTIIKVNSVSLLSPVYSVDNLSHINIKDNKIKLMLASKCYL